VLSGSFFECMATHLGRRRCGRCTAVHDFRQFSGTL
jgi:ribosomal protein S27AE